MIRSRRRDYSQLVQCWADENLLELECKEIGEHYGRYRLHLPEAERAMARSLERYGQLSPVVVCRRQPCAALMRQPHFHTAQHIEQQPHAFPDTVPVFTQAGIVHRRERSSKHWSGKTA